MTLIDITHHIVVDDIVSARGYDEEDDCSLYIRPIFELRQDHPDTCTFCDGSAQNTADSMRWKPGVSIVRFTPSGLEVTR